MNPKSLLTPFVFIISFIVLFSSLPSQVQGQISEGGLPPSFQYPPQTLRSEAKTIHIPVKFSVEDLKTVDAWQVSQGAPLRVATLIDTDVSLSRSGNSVTLPDGQTVRQLHIQAEGAIALMLYYKDFYIPEGGRLFIYNADRSQVLGAYTSQTHPDGGLFATEFVAGDDLILEYVPAPDGTEPRIEIEQIGYGYNHLSVSSDLRADDSKKAGPCMVNINCVEGDDWQEQKKGICRIAAKVGKSTLLCSGSLVNNTAQDMKPYILSAFHCTRNFKTNTSATTSDYRQWVFHFHYERSRCDNTSPAYAHKTMVGCTEVAFTPTEKGSDGLLLLLNQNIPSSYQVFFNGWDRTNRIATSGVGIHHPEGDYMKISTYGNQPVETTTWADGETHERGAVDAHWNVIFDETTNGYAVTESGSSGSPLFNQNKLITGTLTGGNSSCDNPDGINLYGKLFYHWNKYSRDENNRMDIWLDPIQSGVSSLNGLSQAGEETPSGEYKAPTDVTLTPLPSGDLFLTWKAPVYQQIISWTNKTSYYEWGLKGEPFYFGQRWDTYDLKEVDRKLLVAVQFIPSSSVDYSIFVRQGNRIYEQDVITSITDKLITVDLKTPFVIDAHQDLILAIHAKKYSADTYPAAADEGPAVSQKGYVFSKDGKTWEYETRKNNFNFIITGILSSEEGEIIDTRSLSSGSSGIVLKASTHSLTMHPAAVEVLMDETVAIPAFPEITGYTIYRNGLLRTTLPASPTEYTDKRPTSTSAVYQVAAVYGDKESARATAQANATVAIETPVIEDITLSPTLFTQQVRLTNASKVRLLQIYSAEGRLVKQISRPQDVIDTGFLPQGFYIFHLHTDQGVKVIEGIKK